MFLARQRQLATLVVCLSAAVGSSAQDVPRDFEEQTSGLSSATMSLLIDPVVEALDSGDPEQISTQRERLVERLRNPRASAAFRLGLSDRLAEPLALHAESEDSLVSGNALQIAGWIATKETSRLLLDAMSSESDVVRFAAVTAARRTVRTFGQRAPAISEDAASSLVSGLVALVETDASTDVATAAMRSIGEARLARGGKLDAVGQQAISQGTTALGRRVAGLGTDPAANARLLRGVVVILIDARTLLDSGGDGSVPQPVRCGFATLAGHSVAHARRVYLDAGADFGGETTIYTALVDAAEKAIYFGEVGSSVPTNLTEALRDSDSDRDERFLRGVIDLLGPGGSLETGPCSLDGKLFLKG